MRRELPPGGQVTKPYRFLDAQAKGAQPCRSVRAARHALQLFLDVRPGARAAVPDVHVPRRLAGHSDARHRSSASRSPSLAARPSPANLTLRASVAGRILSSTRRSATTSHATTVVLPMKGRKIRSSRSGRERMNWSGCSGLPRAARRPPSPDLIRTSQPDPTPLWTILDWTPGGRGSNWYPKLEY